MKRVHRVVVAAATAVVLTAAPAAASGTQDEDRGPQRQLDAVVEAGAVGALAQVRDERGVWNGTSGVAEWGSARAVPAHGRFRAGSITKTFVATVVLQLVGEGRLELDDPVEAWLPGVVPDGDRITVRHLLNHTSGLHSYQKTLPMPPSQDFLDNRWRTWTADELVRRAVAHPPTFEPPGSAFDYSNTNYTLLGMVVEAVSGRTYAEQIERRIIRPLHLRATTVPGTSPQIRGAHPHGYVPLDDSEQPPLFDITRINPSLFGAGGEIISTTGDLNRFFAALLGGRLVSDALLREMKTPGVEGVPYGLGLAWRDTACGVRAYGNSGDVIAYQAWSFATEDVRRQVTVAATPNFRGDPDDAVEALVEKVICD